MKIVSKKQQGYFGAVAQGKAKGSGLKPDKARKMLAENRGKMQGLPERAPKRKAGRSSSRRSSR